MPSIGRLTPARVPLTNDFLLQIGFKNCPRYQGAYNLARGSDDFNMINQYFVNGFMPRLQTLLTSQSTDPQWMQNACEYIEHASQNDLQLNFSYSAKDLQFCRAIGDYSNLYPDTYGVDELWKLSSYNFTQQLRQIAGELSGLANITSLTA